MPEPLTPEGGMVRIDPTHVVPYNYATKEELARALWAMTAERDQLQDRLDAAHEDQAYMARALLWLAPPRDSRWPQFVVRGHQLANHIRAAAITRARGDDAS